jgi:2-keto-3-deoxy-L-rhamnonate aldolase RhmA|tara:strand:+ start:23227 stop:23904 length:678 start_codon:yes stop_codon:yes gene_type:complete
MKFAWQQIPSPVVSELLCNTGLDGIVIDTEHGFYNNETLFSCIQVINALGKLCYVRVTEPNLTLVRACLDAGIDGIIFSTVETAEQCERINKMCKFPRDGGKRGLGLVRQNRWGKRVLISNPPRIIAQVETKAGIDNIKKIHSYDFDYYMIGPYDLSASLGSPGNFDNKEYLGALESVKEIVPIHQMAVHIPTDVKNQLKKYKGYGMIAVGMDTTGLLEFYKEIT